LELLFFFSGFGVFFLACFLSFSSFLFLPSSFFLLLPLLRMMTKTSFFNYHDGLQRRRGFLPLPRLITTVLFSLTQGKKRRKKKKKEGRRGEREKREEKCFVVQPRPLFSFPSSLNHSAFKPPIHQQVKRRSLLALALFVGRGAL